MAQTLYIHFKPGTPASYKIIWKEVIEATYPPQNVLLFTKLPGLWNIAEITIQDQYKDVNFAIAPVCNGFVGKFMYGVAKAVCKKVSGTALFTNCGCPEISNITYTVE